MATAGEYEIRDEDRLPWLETVDEDYSDGPSIVRIGLLVLLGLAIIAGAIYGIYWYQHNQAEKGTGELIAAVEGDYKVKPDTPGGMTVEGEGDTAFATSEGKDGGNASIDLKAVPEAPVAAAPAATATPKGKTGSAMVPPSNGVLTAPAPGALPMAKPVAAGTSGGALVQLGSFPDEASANTSWARLAKRFSYLGPLGKSVQSAEVKGRTVYRLRVNAGSATQAGELCAKLQLAGEACFVARN
ncbi:MULTISPECIES: SPOR domain-containing protein [unclassified Sphingomonas]|uniref:SPOR domain-containing protein n=1 Tax=unclassified Sphingomonas TaxID=196159 RepID=UPI000BCFF599|nr:MAG: sporulation protein [Sphingomonas sp. 12-62-6]OYX39747.1 MAG: sporulation protein [Sphingomonas sp. 32-62-10]